MREKILIAIFFVIILPTGIAPNEQSHPLSQIKPIDTNLDMFKFNITNVTFVGINLTNPQYALDVAGDVRWSGTLQGGNVPWNLLTGYNLNVPWSGLLGWGNLTGYNLSVNWVGKLGWSNLTSYPYIITQVGSGLNVSTQSLANNITLGVNFTEVQKRVTGSCSGSNAIQVIYDNGSVSCVDINLYGNVTGTGISGYIPLWQTSSSLNNSLINQTNGNIWITSGNLNIVTGALQIGGTSIITSGKHIINIGDVNATRFFQNGVQVIDTINAGSGISINKVGSSATISNTGVLSLTAGNGISLNASTGNILISNTGILGINVNAPLTSTGGQIPTLGFNYNTTAFSIVNNALTLADAYFTGTAYDYRFVNEGQANSITTSMIVDGAITNPKIALNAVNYSQIQQVSCSAGQALQVIGGGSYACVDVNPTGTITGSGSIGYIPLWNGTYSLNNSLISQSGGNIVINSGNLNIQSGGLLIGGSTVIDSSRNANFTSLQIGGTTVIDSNRNIVNVNWVNATNLYASQGIYSVNGYYVGNNQVITSGRIIQAADGSAGSPAFTFNSETNTGMYRAGSGIIGFSTGGSQIATISSSGLNIASGGLQIGTYTVIDSSRNADFASLKIGGTNVIDSSRNLVGINQVNQNLNFGSSYSIYNAAWVNATNLNISGTAMVNNLLIYTQTNCGKLYTNSSGNVLCGVDQGITQETDPLWSGNISAITINYIIKRSSTGITASSIYDNGNVGIGTINPLNKLEVVGTTNITSAGTMFYVDANGNVWVKL